MKTEILKTLVEKKRVELCESNRLFVLARTGTLTDRQFCDYLNNLMYFFQHSVLHLRIAAAHATARGQHEVVAFLEEKAREEAGHDRWALADLRKSGLDQETVDLARVAPATHRLLAYSVDLIERDPELFLAYMFFHEYVTVIAGPDLLADLDVHCGIPPSRITAIAHHVKLDRHHVEDDLAALEAVVARDPRKLEQLVRTTEETGDRASRFYSGSVGLYF